MIVGLAGAFMTAAYMTRCIYLTFFGEYRGGAHADVHADEAEHDASEVGEDAHGAHGPHESGPAITVPLWILSFFAVFAGLLNAAPLHIEKFKEWVEPRVAFPEVVHPAFSWPAAGISVAIALLGIVVAYEYYWARARAAGSRVAQRVARAGKTFLVNKYYLDHLYTESSSAPIKGPIATGAYWVNQHLIDAVLNGVGRGPLGRQVHLRHPRPARCRRSGQWPGRRHGRSRRRGPDRRDRASAVVRTHHVLRGHAVQRRPLDCALTGGVLVR